MSICPNEMDVEQKTHREVPEPEISVRHLADFMAASERARRTIVEGCKYRPIARLVQHKEATLAISGAIQKGALDEQALKDKARFIRNKLADDDFEALTNEVNADYVEKFSEVVASIKLPDADVLPGKVFHHSKSMVSGCVSRPISCCVGSTKPTSSVGELSCFDTRKEKRSQQLSADFSRRRHSDFLKEYAPEEGSDVDKTICVTLNAFTGELYPAPGSSLSMFANMKAACMTIAERWPNIGPPKAAAI